MRDLAQADAGGKGRVAVKRREEKEREKLDGRLVVTARIMSSFDEIRTQGACEDNTNMTAVDEKLTRARAARSAALMCLNQPPESLDTCKNLRAG